MDIVKALIRTCDECGDLTEMVIDENIIVSGDSYHDDLGLMINGFVKGLEYCGRKIEFERGKFVCAYCMDDI